MDPTDVGRRPSLPPTPLDIPTSVWDDLPAIVEVVAVIFKLLALVSLGATGYVLYLVRTDGTGLLGFKATFIANVVVILGGLLAASLLAFFGYVLDMLVGIREQLQRRADQGEEDGDVRAAA